jgi:hypothetical protein
MQRRVFGKEKTSLNAPEGENQFASHKMVNIAFDRSFVGFSGLIENDIHLKKRNSFRYLLPL